MDHTWTVEDFDYQLPESLIATRPLAERSESRLMVIDRAEGTISHRYFHELPQFLHPGDRLVLNRSRVMAARFYGCKATGGRVEFLIERVLSQRVFLAHLKASKSLTPGMIIRIPKERVTPEALGSAVSGSAAMHSDAYAVQILKHDSVLCLYECELMGDITVTDLMDQVGHMPLPPYFHRQDESADWTRYQTVYANALGSAAAPTAGLHFTEALLEKLSVQGISQSSVVLHVGAGTFQPVRVHQLDQHVMHSEWLSVPESTVLDIEHTHHHHHRVIGVGTTSVRALETAAQSTGKLHAYEGESRLFLYPGKTFHVIDGLITNFHLPKSTLLMLVSAFAGVELIREAYQQAIHERYRFFSYGDAMLIL